jgi:hypothetical protein
MRRLLVLLVTAISLACALPAQALGTGLLTQPINTTLPSIGGTPQAGQGLTCSTGIWDNLPLSYDYQWNRDGTPIPGATSSSYAVTDSDVGKQLTCSVTAWNLSGSATATSPGVTATAARIADPDPPATSPPPSSALPELPRGAEVIGLPSRRRCASRRKFRIRVRRVSGVSYASVAVFVNGKRVKIVRGARTTARVDLSGLPKGRFSVRIVVVTTDGRKLSHTRKYRTCVHQRGAKRKHRL